MKRFILSILFLFLATCAFAAPPSRVATYTSGSVISSTDVTSNEDAIFNYLQAGVDTYADDTIVNADIKSTANIQSDKLNLTSIAQGVNITSGGSLTNGGATTLNGNVTIGDAIGDTLTIDAGAWTLTNATTWTLTGALSFSGTIADLGIVTTADINGGTLDGVQVGGTTATGELLINNASDDADGLGSQGTSGQVLKSAGAGSNPTWATQGNTSNVLFSWSGTEAYSAGEYGMANNAALDTAISAATLSNLIFGIDITSATTFLNFKFKKIAEVSTVTIHARIWVVTSGTATLTVDIGGQSNTVTATGTSPAWATASNVDVSGLTNGTTYDGVIKLNSAGANESVYCSAVTLIGSL